MKEDKIPSKNTFGNFIKNARKEKKMTQQELADKLGVAPKSISYIERGKSYPSPENIFNIALALDLSIDEYLFGRTKLDGKISINELNALLMNLSDKDRRIIVAIVKSIAETLQVY